MSGAGPRYWGFLSYSHADARWADWLHRELEAFRVPRRFWDKPTRAGPAPRRLRPIFRDRAELAASADLGETIRDALANSAYLIVICSPAAARSKWVEEEIRSFKRQHGEEAILAVIVDGVTLAPEGSDLECFPRALRFRLGADGLPGPTPAEPAAADLRPGKDGRRHALLKLVSGMLQVDLDELVQRDARRRHRQLLGLTAASLASTAVFAGLALVAVRERDEAAAQRAQAAGQRAQAEGLIEFMIGDLRRTLAPAGRLDALQAVGDRALNYYSAQASHGLDDESLGRRARVLHLLGDIREKQGDLPGAMAFFDEAAKSTRELVARRPNDPQIVFDHAQSVFYIGEVAVQRGDNDLALARFDDYRRLAERLVQLEPRKDDWWAEVDEANDDLGAILLKDGRADEAAARFARALAVCRRLAASHPTDRDRQWDLAQTYSFLSDAEAFRGRAQAAIGDRTQASAIYAALLARTPSDSRAAVALASNRAAIARVEIASGDLADAIVALKAAADQLTQLMEAAPDNALYKANAARDYLLLGQALLDADRPAVAETVASQTLALVEPMARSDRAVTWRGFPLGGARVLAMEITAQRSRSTASQETALQSAAAEWSRLDALASQHPREVNLARATAEAGLLAGDAARLAGRQAEAEANWRSAMGALLRAAPLPQLDRAQVVLRQLQIRLSSRGRGGRVSYEW
jgi:tetratricopeptide (TPR) repeat protein